MNRSLAVLTIVFISAAAYGQQPSVSKSADNGETIYTQRCITCHQAGGIGVQNMIPPLIRNDYVLGDKTVLIKILLNGMSGEIQINGDIYSGEMPPHKDLTDVQIASVLTFVRANFGNNGSEVTNTEVKQIRAEAIK